MEKVKVDGVSSGVRTRPKNKLDLSKDDIFSTVKRNETGRKLCVRFDCYNYLENLRGQGRDKRKEGETETKFFFNLYYPRIHTHTHTYNVYSYRTYIMYVM